MTNKNIMLVSPPLITICGSIVALTFGAIIGKWAFVPLIISTWILFGYFVYRFSDVPQRKSWLAKSEGTWGWAILALVVGLIPLPILLRFYDTLSPWIVWLPWALIAIINPWFEEFYWRGLLLDYTKNWKKWQAVLYTSFFFSFNHVIFSFNSDMSKGIELFISTFIMGVVWAIVYQKTKSLRWCIFSHFLVDTFNLSAAVFLDLFSSGF
ncbi:MAG: CPBP family intramembrane glutamic endopeptidase [Bacteroidota bacterium]